MKRLLVGMVMGVMLATACGGNGDEHTTPSSTKTGVGARPTAVAFLERYVGADGAVRRHDQGDDVVSEGQAYAMLIAELADRPAVVRTIWAWTKKHLQRSDSLLAFHADDQGKVLDHEPASDADVLAAYALLRYDGMDDVALHKDGRRLAEAVLAKETTTGPNGKRMLVAGLWAMNPPITVNPSYWMPSVFMQLGRLTGDDQWSVLAESSVDLVNTLTKGGRELPPDWARMDGDRLVPIGAPSGGGGVQYGLDAMRTPVWFAAGCPDTARDLARQWWQRVLSRFDHPDALALSSDGHVVNSSPHVLPLVGAAAAAEAAGDASARDDLLAKAGRQASAAPTYYGDAWVVLGPAVIEGDLTAC